MIVCAHAQPNRQGGRTSVFGFFRRASDLGSEPAKANSQGGRTPAPIAEEQQAASTSGMPTAPSQPAVSRAQALQRIGGWLTSTATTAGEQPDAAERFCGWLLDHRALTLVAFEHSDDGLTACCNGCNAGERLGVAAARGATAIQRLTGAEKYQVRRRTLPVSGTCQVACSTVIDNNLHGGKQPLQPLKPNSTSTGLPRGPHASRAVGWRPAGRSTSGSPAAVGGDPTVLADGHHAAFVKA